MCGWPHLLLLRDTAGFLPQDYGHVDVQKDAIREEQVQNKVRLCKVKIPSRIEG
jgi:hypothetical protein